MQSLTVDLSRPFPCVRLDSAVDRNPLIQHPNHVTWPCDQRRMIWLAWAAHTWSQCARGWSGPGSLDGGFASAYFPYNFYVTQISGSAPFQTHIKHTSKVTKNIHKSSFSRATVPPNAKCWHAAKSGFMVKSVTNSTRWKKVRFWIYYCKNGRKRGEMA